MNLFVMELLEFAWNVGEIGIEDRIAFCFPPEPILNDGIQRYVLFTIAVRNSKNLVLRNVAVLLLKESICPFGKHRSVSGQVPVRVDQLIHLWTTNEVVVDRVASK